jgi:hypothetical protein
VRPAVGALLIVGLATLTATPARAQDKAAERLGTVRFATSCAPAAQAPFNRAVALLHSFHLDAAVGAFVTLGKGADGDRPELKQAKIFLAGK